MGLDFYNGRMYPYGCEGAAQARFSVKKDGAQLNSSTATTSIGFGYVYLENAQAGTYTIEVAGQTYGRDAIHDFTVSVYARDKV